LNTKEYYNESYKTKITELETIGKQYVEIRDDEEKKDEVKAIQEKYSILEKELSDFLFEFLKDYCPYKNGDIVEIKSKQYYGKMGKILGVRAILTDSDYLSWCVFGAVWMKKPGKVKQFMFAEGE